MDPRFYILGIIADLKENLININDEQKEDLIEQMKEEMLNAAKDLEFERAAQLRDEIERMKKLLK